MLADIWNLLKKTMGEWLEDKAPKLAASLSYYTAFSLAPLMILMVVILSWLYGDAAARGQVLAQMRSLMGGPAAQATQEMIKSAWQQSGGALATVISIVILLFGASGVFGELQDSMNIIWEVQTKPGRGIRDIVRDRFFSVAMVFGIVFLLMVSLVISTMISGVGARLTGGAKWFAATSDVVLSIAIIAALFAMLFKFLPDAKIRWRDVWLGGLITSVLFAIGKYLLGLYLARRSTMSAYGAAGSFAALLIWVYYSSQILFFGAEFTQVYAKEYGRKPEPAENAVPMTEEKREQMGIGHERKEKARQAVAAMSVHQPLPQPKGERWKKYALAGGGLAVGYLVGGRGLIQRWVKAQLDRKQVARPGMWERLAKVENRVGNIARAKLRARGMDMEERIDLIEKRIDRAAKKGKSLNV